MEGGGMSCAKSTHKCQLKPRLMDQAISRWAIRKSCAPFPVLKKVGERQVEEEAKALML